MKISEKIEKLFDSLDVVRIEKGFECLIKKDKVPDVPKECLDFAQEVLGVGDYPDRNPSWWKTFEGAAVEHGSEKWRNGIANLFRLTAPHDVNEIDNIYNHLSVDIVLEVLAINAKNLPEGVFEGAKCVTVVTAFGIFPLKEE
jgi:hypothetical protein